MVLEDIIKLAEAFGCSAEERQDLTRSYNGVCALYERSYDRPDVSDIRSHAGYIQLKHANASRHTFSELYRMVDAWQQADGVKR